MKKALTLFVFLIMTSLCHANTVPYDYPFVNPYEATVVGTPSLYQEPLPEKVPTRERSLTVFEDRKIPDVFWYHDKLRYALTRQSKMSPLIFVIAGTGSDHNSLKMKLLEKAFFNAGFHVISLPSPTFPNFIVTASTTGVPGDLREDSEDLYRVMELIWEKEKARLDVSEFYLTGYSLGGAQSAFIARIDEDRRLFNFSKVLMINPPVSLYNSMQILDRMLVDNIPGGLDNFSEFYDNTMAKFASVYEMNSDVSFDDDFLFAVYKRYPPREQGVKALIGFAFQLSSANMLFTSDVMSNSGFVVPKNRVLGPYESLTDYFKVSARAGFSKYFEYLFLPYFQSKDTGYTREKAIRGSSIQSIEGYLRRTEKIAMVTNEDDVILAPGEAEYLKEIFGSRAMFYPNGGHCGNMAHKDNVEFMIDFFSK